MIFEKFIDIDLGQVSYIVGCDATKEAFVVDPRRDIQEYVDFIEKNSLTLKYIFNTHTHADYIGGHVELAYKYNVDNIFQKDTPIKNFKIIKVSDNDEFFIGNTLKIKILETPGHTPFDICLLLSENKVEKILFTGDTLFIGDTGRPDLLGDENREGLANSSYESAIRLYNIKDSLTVFPSHIAGSLCGKNLSHQYFSTIGIEKETNEGFRTSQISREKYVERLLSQNIETPNFFRKMAGMNINGPKLLKEILEQIKSIEFEDIKEEKNIQIVDLREPNDFHRNHIEGSINICDKSNVSFIAGNILDYEKDIYLVESQNSNINEFITKLLRVGFDNIKGVINSDFTLIDSKYLYTSKIISIDDVSDEFINILLDENCSDAGKPLHSNISSVLELDLSQYKKIIISCNYGFKSSAIASIINNNNNNIYFMVGK